MDRGGRKNMAAAGQLVLMVVILAGGAGRFAADTTPRECQYLIGQITDCQPYLEGRAKSPTSACCKGINTTLPKGPVCLCQFLAQVRQGSALARILGIQEAKIYQLPSSCALHNFILNSSVCSMLTQAPIAVPAGAPTPPSVVVVPVPVQDGAPLSSGPHKKPGGGHPSVIISVSSVGVLFLLLTLAFSIYLHKNKVDRALEDHDICDLTAKSLLMELHTIRVATQNFATDRKLGKGGFGEVYKGTLENGQEIAVKRLSRESRQGLAEFKTEVLIVAKLQHRNLVKLLGFCASGREKILVYEYLPNSSLDKFLFDPIRRLSLNWQTRFKIIFGIAKGLLYLHEDSCLKIIHRDLKTSNILLDDAMNPKIADFGLAKLFSVDQTQDATKTIVGTYGYMAPEYILTGHYSVKSDVYTFGIIVLEVVSGQRNKYLNHPDLEEAILHRAWRLWTEGEPLNLVDETLGENYSVEDVMKCIHVALLCIQENVGRRPSMRIVVSALGGETIKLPYPTPPNFLASTDPVSGANASTSGSGQGQVASVYVPSDITLLKPR